MSRILPALTLAFLAPMFAEVLPGATRFSSIFVFPIEMAVWGGGAVMARALVRSRGRGWWSLLFLGLALAIAEECLIQQTSLAPLVIRLKGETWARAGDVNYVYLIWALVYEAAWVVLLPTLVCEMMFPERREQPWLNRAGAIVTAILFALGCFLAWFSWTQIARVKVFHQPPFTPPISLVAAAVIAILILIVAALRAPDRLGSGTSHPPWPWLVGLLGAFWAAIWFGLVVLAFGIAPQLNAPAVVLGAVAISAMLLFLVPRWAADAAWSSRHDYALVAGALTSSMLVSFAGFIGGPPPDLWFKVIVNVIAFAWLVWLGRWVLSRS